MDEYELDEDPCPKCGADAVRFRRCHAVGCDDGLIDMYEFDDPLWYSPGDYEPCEECAGTGVHRWCSACGYDLVRQAAG